MKIIYTSGNWRSRTQEIFEIDSYVQRVCEPLRYEYGDGIEGRIEKSQKAADKSAFILGRLIKNLADRKILSTEDICNILNLEDENIVDT